MYVEAAAEMAYDVAKGVAVSPCVADVEVEVEGDLQMDCVACWPVELDREQVAVVERQVALTSVGCLARSFAGGVDAEAAHEEADLVAGRSLVLAAAVPEVDRAAGDSELRLVDCRRADWACRHSQAVAAPGALGWSSFDGCAVGQGGRRCATMGGTCPVAEEMGRA